MTCATLGMSAAPPAAREEKLAGGIGLRRSRSEPLLLGSLKVAHSALPQRLKTSRSIGAFGFSIPGSIRSLLFEPEEFAGDAMRSETGGSEPSVAAENVSEKRTNWVQRICEVRSRWRDRQAKDGEEEEGEECLCGVSYESDDAAEREEAEWDREAFSRFLSRATWTETKLFSKLAFLCNMAYAIPEIQPDELVSYYGLRLVTSSLDKKLEAAIRANLEAATTCAPPGLSGPEREPEPPTQSALSSPEAYELAASAASYIHSRAKGILSPEAEGAVIHEGQTADEGRKCPPNTATCVAAASVTAVVAAEEKARLEAARDLQSLHSSPCEWFACDEAITSTRCFVIQGSDSLSSWQANLFFEPTEFEGTKALVHRGIYEAAKGIYRQLTPEIESHLRTHGARAQFRFTGHSLGGSLSLLISLMLLARGAIPRPALLPVVTFGSPAVFCGGRLALDALGLDGASVCAVMMHRDIVPRAFSCNYPGHVARLLKRLNSSFRTHPCLNADKLLYSPLGRQYILQPDASASPPHPLLPPGSAMYALEADGGGAAALRAFLNTPHPLETLSHPAAYGSEGAISRDHHSKNYLLAVNALLRQQTRFFVRRSRRHRLKQWWPIATSPVTETAAEHTPMPVHTWPAHLCVEPAAKVATGA